jgi:hypothetical protein
VVLTGVTLADMQVGMEGTWHRRTLAELFASALRANAPRYGVAALTIAVQCADRDRDGVDAANITEVVEEIFNAAAAAAGVEGEVDFGARFAVSATPVSTAADAAAVLEAARPTAPPPRRPGRPPSRRRTRGAGRPPQPPPPRPPSRRRSWRVTTRTPGPRARAAPASPRDGTA